MNPWIAALLGLAGGAAAVTYYAKQPGTASRGPTAEQIGLADACRCDVEKKYQRQLVHCAAGAPDAGK